MKDAKIQWFNLLRKTKDKLIWLKLNKALIKRFEGRQYDNPFEELKDLKQSKVCMNTITQFNYVLSQLEGYRRNNTWDISLRASNQRCD